jgi:cysteinyl-tRNA synthetase
LTLRIYNTLTRSKQPFEPVAPGKVRIYLCGPTVYKEAHIGHMVGPVIFDCIKRYLTYCGYEVTWVVNITDVDDKLIAEANRLGITMAQLAEENVRDYLANLAALGVDSIDHMPKATENIEEIIRFIQDLIGKGFAYQSDGDVYFEVSRDPEYGKLSNRSPESLQGEGGEMASRKRSAGDFALWKAAKPGEPSWDSPWGAGRPGWHIECSAMSRRLLGEEFDIHGGGLDLIFPHHENEIAQSECCHGKPMARFWMHNGLLKRAAAAGKIGGRSDRDAPGDAPADAAEKMSRSKGAGGLADQIRQFGGETIRFFLLRTHYRSTVLFSEEALEETRTALSAFHRFFERFERITGESFHRLASPQRRDQREADPPGDELVARAVECREKFNAAMDDDFNTGLAMAELFELVRMLNRYIDENGLDDPAGRSPEKLDGVRRGTAVLRELSNVLGLFLRPIESRGGDDQLVAQLMELIIAIRAAARKQKDFATSDRIRDGLAQIGIVLEDRKGETVWRAQGS